MSFKKLTWKEVNQLFIFGVLYYLAVLIGLESRVGAIALFWPANGVAFAFFLTARLSLWPLYVFVLSLGYIAGMWATGDYPWVIIWGALIANLIQTLVGSSLVRYFLPDMSFSTIKEIVITMFFTAVVGSMASAFFSVMVLGPGFMKTPFELWASGVIDNTGSTMLSLPFFLLLVANPTFSFKSLCNRLNKRNVTEFVILFIVTFVLIQSILSVKTEQSSLIRTLPYLLVPCVLWCALRFSAHSVAAMAFYIGFETVRHTAISEGPFVDPNNNGFITVLTLHLYISVITITGLLVSALISQQRMIMYSLAGSIAHEVRGPLTHVLYTLDELKKSPDTYVSNTCEKTVGLVRQGLQLTDMILLEMKDAVPVRNRVLQSAQTAVHRAADLYAYRNRCERDKVNVVTRAGEDFFISVEPTLFNHIIFNLLKNALYYIHQSETAEITISLDSNEKFNLIQVKDTGPGIDAHVLPLLFSEFYSYKKTGGTGLGLFYCKRTMKSFGGDISCTSVKGKFTTFSLFFPKVIAENKPEVDTKSEGMSASYSNITVLYVDDEKIHHEMFMKVFEPFFAHIEHAYNIHDALDRFKIGSYQAVITDINMPGGSGLELSKNLRDLGTQVPIIGLGGDPSVTTQRSGMDAYLQKPVVDTNLYTVLTQLLKEKSDSVNPSQCIEQAKEKPAVDKALVSTPVSAKQEQEETQIHDNNTLSNADSLYSIEASLIHNIATPVATITLCRDVLQSCFENLFEYFDAINTIADDSRYELSQECLELKDIASKYRDYMRASTSCTKSFWKEVDKPSKERNLELVADFYKELSLIWRDVHNLNINKLLLLLPQLLDHYQLCSNEYENSDNAVHIASVSERELQQCQTAVNSIKNAVSAVNDLLGEYEKTITS